MSQHKMSTAWQTSASSLNQHAARPSDAGLAGAVSRGAAQQTPWQSRKPCRVAATQGPVSSTQRVLYPTTLPRGNGLLAVDEPHSIHWEEYGSPDGVPLVVVHGGPGAACFSNHTRFFDPVKWRIILVDQRGCGRSTPSGCLLGNTTAALVGDLEALRQELGISEWVLFGGSWGAALAMAYAQAHPAHAAGLILRGLTLMRRADIDWLFRGGGAQMLFPGCWEQFLSHIPPQEQCDPVAAYYRRLTAPDKAVREAAARAWSGLEMAVGFRGRVDAVQWWDGSKWVQQAVYADQHEARLRHPHPAPSLDAAASCQPAAGDAVAAAEAAPATWEPALDRFEGGPDCSSLAQALLTCHFCQHDAFLEPGQLLRGAAALADLPIIAVHGRQDHVCPPALAYDLHRALSHMELRIVPGAGHSMYEAPTVHELVWAGDRMHALLTGSPPAAPDAIPAGALA